MRTCEAPDCDNWLDQERRSDSIYCSPACKKRAMRARKRERKNSNFLASSGTPSQSRESDGGYPTHSNAADERFRAMVDADKAARIPDAQAREWERYARRHGSIHPDEQAARISRGLQERDEDWVAGTARFRHEPRSLAEQARASRQRQRRPVIDAGPLYDDDDPDLMEPATMVDGNIFKTGYRHASNYL